MFSSQSDRRALLLHALAGLVFWRGRSPVARHDALNPFSLLELQQALVLTSMSDDWANRMTVPVVRTKEFAELSACYQEALKERGALDCTYRLWSDMTAAEKAKVAKTLPSAANNWYVN
jgi:hypothetical protein